MFRLARFLKNYKIQSILGPIFKMIEATFELFVPIVMAKIIDVGIHNKNTSYIYKMGAVLILLGLLGLVSSLTAQYFAARASMGFGTALRTSLFSHINSFSHKELDKIGIGALITRLTSDINQAQTGVNMILRLFLRSPFIVLGAIIMAFTINVKLTLIFLLFTPAIAFVIYIIMSKTIPIYKTVQKRQDDISTITRENLSGIRVIRAFSKEKFEQKRFADTSNSLLKEQLLAGRISALLNPATYVLVNIATILIIWFGGVYTFKGDITQGEVIALVSYMSQILLALVALANLIVIITKAQASSVRINDIFDIKPSLTDDNASIYCLSDLDNSIPVIEYRNVCYSYYETAEKYALKNISFKVSVGETVGIIGGTGAGKSTLINLMPRFIDVTEGEILFNGNNVKSYTFETLRKNICVVAQKSMLFKGTIKDNIKWGKKNASDDEIWKALEDAQAAEFVKEKGLDFEISQGGKNLSGGQKQRLSIARALVAQPKILILDDSSSALDFATDAKLRRALNKNSNNRTTFIVSQRATAIKHADFIIVLDNGEIKGIGNHNELLRTCETYREICSSQLSKEELNKK